MYHKTLVEIVGKITYVEMKKLVIYVNYYWSYKFHFLNTCICLTNLTFERTTGKNHQRLNVSDIQFVIQGIY